MSVAALSAADDAARTSDAPRPDAGVEVRLERLSKSFGSVTAVDNVNLTIPAGAFVTLLGPSGSGKTTTLNLIAGFLAPNAGNIAFDGRPVASLPPHRRNIGMVFQSYALFPHMTVFDNVAYPLRMRNRLAREALTIRVGESLELVGLTKLEARYPRQLSGGQQQRVAMARALVSRPRLLLMDEPLGALDKKLRERLQGEIKDIHRRIGSTFVYVTHDQTEALTMSDLVVVMRDSRIVQVGSPRSVYEAPVDAFVADFLGGANLLPGEVMANERDAYAVRIANGRMISVPQTGASHAPGSKVLVFIRPEDMKISHSEEMVGNVVTTAAVVREVLFLGESFKVTAMVGPHPVVLRAPRVQAEGIEIGGHVMLAWSPERSCALAAPTGSVSP
ncbi:MAG: ABC transporter ATP-binding protein [Hyphomicrobiales bacterium]|nr:ABC transporter ATP-binding protein [Hyphomicrobiales bacterium]